MQAELNTQLEPLLMRSADFHDDLEALWSEALMPEDKRAMATVGFCSIVRQHVLSQQHLLALGFDITAMTLVRPAFESLVRGIWCLQGAPDEWIDKFMAPHEDGANVYGETMKGPPVDAMLATIEKYHPTFVHASLKELKDLTWLPMHSYVHAGIRPVIQALMGSRESETVAVVLNGNGFVMLATNVMLMACGYSNEALKEIQLRHPSCFPPTLPISSSGSAASR